ncbi:MAG TPA: DUF4276 family protein [Armatimonadota bacterium]
MRITIIVEGRTEKALLPHLRRYLERHLKGQTPDLNPFPYDGRVPKGEQLRRKVRMLLAERNGPDYVIALTDVYTGTPQPDFLDAADARNKMKSWVGDEPRFHPHAAQHDFEAWLLPYWPTIQRLAGTNRGAPDGAPESVNHGNPPAHRLADLFYRAGRGKQYVKPRDAGRILRENDLAVAVDACPELKALVNTILTLCKCEPVP